MVETDMVDLSHIRFGLKIDSRMTSLLATCAR